VSGGVTCRVRYEEKLATQQRMIERLKEKLVSRQNSAMQLSKIYEKKQERLVSTPMSPPPPGGAGHLLVDTADEAVDDGHGGRAKHLNSSTTSLDLDDAGSVADSPQVDSLNGSLLQVSTAGLSSLRNLAASPFVDWHVNPGTRSWIWGTIAKSASALLPSALIGLGAGSGMAASTPSRARKLRATSSNLPAPDIPDNMSTNSDASEDGNDGRHGTLFTQPVPCPVLADRQLRAVSACEDRALLLTTSGDVFMWNTSLPVGAAAREASDAIKKTSSTGSSKVCEFPVGPM
jgi:hypothetical protein